MNEKIKEPFYSLMWKASIGYNDSWSQVDPEVLEKFAELIVQECAKVVNDTEYPYEDQSHAGTWNACCVWSASKLKEHFGVKQ